MPWYEFRKYCKPKEELKEDLEKSLNELFDIAQRLIEYSEKAEWFYEISRNVEITADKDGIKVKSKLNF